MAEIVCFPNTDLSAQQMLAILAQDKPKHAVALVMAEDGEWHPSWTQMTFAELSFAISVLQAELFERMAGRVP